MQQMILLTIFVLFIEYQRGVSSPLADWKVLCLQQSPNCCPMSHLTLNQRYQIWAFRHLKPAQIAKKIGKHRSVVTREIARSGMALADYNAQKAQQTYLTGRAKNATKATATIHQAIQQGLHQQWSPEQIKGRSQRLQVPMLSRAAIYNHIWADQRQGGTLYQNLRHASKPYRKRYGKADGRTKAAKQATKPSIDQRPVIVFQKSRFGDWEADTVIGPNHKGVLVTLTERTSNYLLMKQVVDKSASYTCQAIVDSLRKSGLPVHTITSDNGTEFANYQQIAQPLNTEFYFAHPYHAWERGANEHNNKLIRQYIPKKMDFAQMPEEQLKNYCQRINDRPRKKVNYATPDEYIKSIVLTPFVAFQT
jgi:IS30 family transposase